jgi:hypothetical protein
MQPAFSQQIPVNKLNARFGTRRPFSGVLFGVDVQNVNYLAKLPAVTRESPRDS